MKKSFLAFLFMTVFAVVGWTQVTTSGLSGKIVSGQNESLPGATVVAVHQPSGTQYAAISNAEGFYQIQGARPGGPYEVSVSFVGYRTETYTDLTLLLGEVFELNVVMTDGVDLSEVVVVGRRNSIFNTQKTGATTNISNEGISRMPTINRSISDIARISPDRKSTRLNSSHVRISYAVFCLKK